MKFSGLTGGCGALSSHRSGRAILPIENKAFVGRRGPGRPRCQRSESGTMPPFSASLRMTAACSQVFMAALSPVSPA